MTRLQRIELGLPTSYHGPAKCGGCLLNCHHTGFDGGPPELADFDPERRTYIRHACRAGGAARPSPSRPRRRRALAEAG